MSLIARSLALLVLAFLPVSAAPAAGQAGPDAAGTWSVTWDAGLRTRGAEILAVTRRLTGTLILQVQGDSLSGSWSPLAGAPAVPVAGSVRDTVLRFEAAPREIADGAETLLVRTTFEGRFTAAGMDGTLFLHFPDRPALPRRWEAVRAR